MEGTSQVKVLAGEVGLSTVISVNEYPLAIRDERPHEVIQTAAG